MTPPAKLLKYITRSVVQNMATTRDAQVLTRDFAQNQKPLSSGGSGQALSIGDLCPVLAVLEVKTGVLAKDSCSHRNKSDQ